MNCLAVKYVVSGGVPAASWVRTFCVWPVPPRPVSSRATTVTRGLASWKSLTFCSMGTSKPGSTANDHSMVTGSLDGPAAGVAPAPCPQAASQEEPETPAAAAATGAHRRVAGGGGREEVGGGGGGG